MSRSVRVVVDALVPGVVILDEQASRYLVKVHRCRVGDEVELFEPRQGLCSRGAVLVSDRLPAVRVEVTAVVPAPSYEMPLTLLVGVGKNDKPEQAVRDVTAFGAERLVLVLNERSVAKSSGEARGDRFSRVAEQVARQCQRGRLPVIEGPIPWLHLLERPSDARRFICAFHPSAVPLAAALQRDDLQQPVEVFVGPEGGFSDAEVEQALEVGFRPVSLGPYVLRAEVACSAVLATARSLWDAQRQGGTGAASTS